MDERFERWKATRGDQRKCVLFVVDGERKVGGSR